MASTPGALLALISRMLRRASRSSEFQLVVPHIGCLSYTNNLLGGWGPVVRIREMYGLTVFQSSGTTGSLSSEGASRNLQQQLAGFLFLVPPFREAFMCFGLGQ